MKSLPKTLRREGTGIYYGQMLVATLNARINLIKAIKNEKYLLRFGERNRHEVCGTLDDMLRKENQASVARNS